jgi:hypothetical protein
MEPQQKDRPKSVSSIARQLAARLEIVESGHFLLRSSRQLSKPPYMRACAQRPDRVCAQRATVTPQSTAARSHGQDTLITPELKFRLG